MQILKSYHFLWHFGIFLSIIFVRCFPHFCHKITRDLWAPVTPFFTLINILFGLYSISRWRSYDLIFLVLVFFTNYLYSSSQMLSFSCIEFFLPMIFFKSCKFCLMLICLIPSYFFGFQCLNLLWVLFYKNIN